MPRQKIESYVVTWAVGERGGEIQFNFPDNTSHPVSVRTADEMLLILKLLRNHDSTFDTDRQLLETGPTPVGKKK